MLFAVYAYGNIEMKREVLRGRKVKETELIHLSEVHKLFQRLSASDTVIVYSVKDFASVTMFSRFVAEVTKRGVSVKYSTTDIIVKWKRKRVCYKAR